MIAHAYNSGRNKEAESEGMGKKREEGKEGCKEERGGGRNGFSLVALGSAYLSSLI